MLPSVAARAQGFGLILHTAGASDHGIRLCVPWPGCAPSVSCYRCEQSSQGSLCVGFGPWGLPRVPRCCVTLGAGHPSAMMGPLFHYRAACHLLCVHCPVGLCLWLCCPHKTMCEAREEPAPTAVPAIQCDAYVCNPRRPPPFLAPQPKHQTPLLAPPSWLHSTSFLQLLSLLPCTPS
ncbi:uncharacterized protein LOC119472991 [Cebus imitator]|uniref:uncharacterized protein LOC119472991 n=1 Tax=Cebus imitator TaxID=2715852 RepID=UPI00189A883F|nr:uncharacterized protein LOC119472991 [Cebus imitator]